MSSSIIDVMWGAPLYKFTYINSLNRANELRERPRFLYYNIFRFSNQENDKNKWKRGKLYEHKNENANAQLSAVLRDADWLIADNGVCEKQGYYSG